MPTMRGQAISGCAARVAADTLFAASPIVWMAYCTAARIILLPRNSSHETPPAKATASRAAISISSNRASSPCIDDLCRLEDVLSPDVVPALLNSPAAYKIDLPPKDSLQLFGHVRVSTPGPMHTGLEREEHVDITVRPEVVAQHRAEQRQLLDAPLPAERRDLLARDGYARG